MSQSLVARRFTQATLFLLLTIAAVHAVAMLAIGFRHVTLDAFAFRQTQTAISAWVLARGGPWFAYETPVLGSPWAIPFEFPTYQWLVAILSLTGLKIPQAGRLVSFIFFVATLGPIYSLTTTYRAGRAACVIMAILFLSSPLYVFWGRSVMIETAAVFFAAAWLALLARFLFQPSPLTFVTAVLAGCCATLTKSTTFPAFAFLGALLVLHRIYLAYFADLRFPLRRLLAILALAFVPFLAGSVWVAYSEHIRGQNQIGGLHLSLAGLKTWNFGTMEQRLSPALWRDVLVNRVLPDLLGYGVIPGLLAIGAALGSRRSMIIALACTAAFLLPFLLVTNVHMVHSYYQVANGIFLLGAVGAGLSNLFRQGRVFVALALLVALVVGQLGYFREAYAFWIYKDQKDTPVFQIATAAKAATTDQQSLIVFGLGWSSEVLYYAQRRGVAVPLWLPDEAVNRLLASPSSFLKDFPLGAIVDCYGNSLSAQAVAMRDALKANPVLTSIGNCRLLGPGHQ